MEIIKPENTICRRKTEILRSVVMGRDCIVLGDNGRNNIFGVLRDHINSQNISIMNMNRWTGVKNIIGMTEAGENGRYLIVRQFDGFVRSYEEFKEGHEEAAGELIRLKSHAPGMMLTFEGEDLQSLDFDQRGNIAAFLNLFSAKTIPIIE